MLPMPALGSLFGSLKLNLIKHAPTLLVAGGTAMLTAAVPLAAKASFTYVDEVMVPYLSEASEIQNDKKKDEEERKLALHESQKAFLLKTLKRYAPAIGLAVAGISCIAAGHSMQLKRLAGLGAALALAEQDKQNLLRGMDEIENAANGEETEEGAEKAVVLDTPPAGHLMPTEDFRNRVFGPENKNWDPSPIVSRNFLDAVERHMNDRLRWQGHLFLNEVYSALGMPKTRMGAVLGWSRKADPDAVVLFSAIQDETGWADGDTEDETRKVETIWHLDLSAPHNLVA